MKYNSTIYNNGNVLFIISLLEDKINYDLAISNKSLKSNIFLPDTLIIYHGDNYIISNKSKLYKLDLSDIDLNYSYQVESKIIKKKSKNYLNSIETKLLIYFMKIPIPASTTLNTVKFHRINKLIPITQNKKDYKIYI
jgi:hypothetical protein